MKRKKLLNCGDLIRMKSRSYANPIEIDYCIVIKYMYTCDESNYYLCFSNNKIDLVGDHRIINNEKQ